MSLKRKGLRDISRLQLLIIYRITAYGCVFYSHRIFKKNIHCVLIEVMPKLKSTQIEHNSAEPYFITSSVQRHGFCDMKL